MTEPEEVEDVDELRADEPQASEAGLGRTVREAVAAWGKTVFGAPRDLTRLVVGEPVVRDEVIERVYTQVVRRAISETITTTRETRSTQPRIDPNRLDPFAYTNESLKAASEYVQQCGRCGASGSTGCGGCIGTGQMACPTCDGSGMEWKHYKTVASKQVKCKNCRTTGRVRCTSCAGTGTTPCGTCRGSGHLLAWLTMTQTESVQVTVHPESPIVHAHPRLRQGRELPADELDDFAVVSEASATRLDLASLPEESRSLPRIHLDAVNPRFERVTRQQYLKLSVVRRDVSYEMCGKTGTLVLSGNQLAPSTTAEAVGPIRRRLWAWALLAAFVAVIAALLRTAFVGSTAYFETAQAITLGLVASAVVLATLAIGSVLRSWRGGFRFWPIGRPVLGAAAGSVLSLAAICIVGVASKPSAGEAREALAAGDPAKARVVIQALKASDSRSAEVLEAEDLVKLAEAKYLKGDERLAVLDDVAGRRGPSAKEAALAARTDRLTTIRKFNATGDSKAALAAADKWFPSSKTTDDPEVAEERAKAHEVARGACVLESCKLLEAANANSAHGTPARLASADADRAQLLKVLDPKTVDDKDAVERLKHLRRVGEVGAETLKGFPTDDELQKQSKVAVTFAETERAKVMLLLSPLPVIEELLGATANTANKVATFALDGVTVYAALDGNGVCAGVYAIGVGNARVISSKEWTADHLLSQAIGKPVKIHAPTQLGATATSRWYEAGIPVIARWHDGDLVELRIGDATP